MKRIKKENKEKIMERIRKAGDPDNYEISWNEEGTPYKIKDKVKIKRGKSAKGQGARFESKVREDLESKGKIVDKWTNNVDLEKDKVVPVKRKFLPRGLGPTLSYMGISTMGTGFPDFIAIKHIHEGLYSVIGVEVKMNGTLSKIEKEKCAWYLQKEIFSQIWIAKKGEKRGEIKYDDFLEKYGKKYNKT